jgi:hypothetical protein
MHAFFLLRATFLDHLISLDIITLVIFREGARVSVVVKTLCYKPEDRRFETR